MADTFSDAHLEEILMSVGAHLEVGAPAAPSAHRHSTWLRRLAVAAVILIALLVVGLAVAPVRSAVADWLGIGSTHVVKVPGGVDTSGLPLIQERLRPVSRAEAEAVLRDPLPTVAALGDPQIVVLPPEGGVLMGWTEGDTTLWVHPIDIDPDLFLQKLVAVGENVEPVEGVGEAALYVEGTHILETPGRRLAARSVLLWVQDGVEYRLESDLSRDEMIDVAKSVQP